MSSRLMIRRPIKGTLKYFDVEGVDGGIGLGIIKATASQHAHFKFYFAVLKGLFGEKRLNRGSRRASEAEEYGREVCQRAQRIFGNETAR